MPGVITTGNHPKALWPGIEKWFGMKYTEYPAQWSEVFKQSSSDKKYEENVESTSFGLMPQKSEGAATVYDSHAQGVTARYTHLTYSLGYIVTAEEISDNQYTEVSMNRAESLSFSARQTKEVVAAGVFNRGFTAAYAGGDGQELLSVDHPSLAGIQSNILAAGADLSEASIESLAIQVSNAKNSRGMQIALKPQKLIVTPNDQFEAYRIVNSVLQSNSANNDINAIRAMTLFPKGVFVWQYLTDDLDAFYITTDAPTSLRMFKRWDGKFSKDNDFDTDNAKAKYVDRYSFGWSDWRAAFSSEGG